MCSTTAAVYLVKIEDQIQLTDIAKVSVKNLHKMVHKLQCDQLIVTAVDTHDKVQAGISLVHNLQCVSCSIKQRVAYLQCCISMQGLCCWQKSR